MTTQRFFELLEAYGSDMRRWPEGERDTARALAASGQPDLQAAMDAQSVLDGWLGEHVVPAPDAALARRIADNAMPSQRSGWRWLWPGAGLAGASLAGCAAGAFAVTIALRATSPVTSPVTSADWPERSTSFTEPSADWSEE